MLLNVKLNPNTKWAQRVVKMILMTIVDYTGRWGTHEAFLHKTSATEANVTIFRMTKLAKSRYIGIIS